MPIESPQLDDLSYAPLFEQLRRQIPIYAPEWTDHNESDPGITLLQLFAHLGEQVGYRLNRVPDKVYLEFLRLIGMRLAPADAARTLLSFILGKPELSVAATIDAGSTVRSKSKAVFEVDAKTDLVPGQPAALVTTLSADLRDIAAGTGAPAAGDTAASYVASRFSLAWDGKQPKLKDWPQQPVPMFFRPNEAAHQNLWVGLAFNPLASAGFLGQRVTLTIQLDDDEQPDPRGMSDCNDRGVSGPSTLGGVSYAFYRQPRPGQLAGAWLPLPILADTTDGWTRSGQLRFDVPTTLGPVPDGEWKDPRVVPPQTIEEMCATATGSGTPIPTPIKHPLIGAIKNPVSGFTSIVPISGWLRVQFTNRNWRFSLRAVSFNVAAATNAVTSENQLLGRGTGLSDQTAQLPARSILARTLDLALEDPVDLQLHRWTEVADFDTAGPDDRVYVLDPEAGTIYFGDGIRGRVPAIARRIVALRFRAGGGKSAEAPAGDVNQAESLPSAVQDTVNIVAARGGRDAETLDQAKKRAPSVLRTRDRAVTAEDFEVIARETPGVRIARTEAVALRQPLVVSGEDAPGLDVDTPAPGVVSVVVVPDELGPYPTAPEGVLRTVCRWLDQHRLITTEVYVVPAQYVRIFDLEVTIVPTPGWSESDVRATVSARLEAYFHVLTGGASGEGTAFGAVIHHAELVAQVMRSEGVDQVEQLTAWFDNQAPAPAGEPPPMTWRLERAVARRLTGCPAGAGDTNVLALYVDENVFVDTATLNVSVRA